MIGIDMNYSSRKEGVLLWGVVVINRVFYRLK